MTRVGNTQWYSAMGWQERSLPETIIEWAIDAPSSYKAPDIGGMGQIDTLGLYINKFKSKDKKDIYYVWIDHGLLGGASFDVGTAQDLDTAKNLAVGFMYRYGTWAKVLNWIKKIHKIDIRTWK